MAGGLDSASMECLGASLVPEYVGFTIMAILTVLTLVLTFRLRVAQVQVFCWMRHWMRHRVVMCRRMGAPTRYHSVFGVFFIVCSFSVVFLAPLLFPLTANQGKLGTE